MNPEDLITKSPRWDFMVEHGGEAAKVLTELIRVMYTMDALEPKTRELVFLGIQTALGLDNSVRTHTERALLAGASRDEIISAMMVSVANAGVGGVIKCLPVAVEIINRWHGTAVS